MIRNWTFAVAVLAAIALTTPASADTTKELLATCKTDAKGCSDFIFGTRVLLQMNKTKAARDSTCLPKGWKGTEVVKTITDWIAAHPELENEPPSVSIDKAFAANYPTTPACRATYVSVDPFPASTQAFLAYCEREPKGQQKTCFDEILEVQLTLRLDNPNSLCRINADTKDKKAFHNELVARVAAIRAWLSEHKETAPQPRGEGIAAAFKALYAPPCAPRTDSAPNSGGMTETHKERLKVLCAAGAANPKECKEAGVN